MMPQFVAAIEARARAIISGLDEATGEPASASRLLQSPASTAHKPKRKKKAAAG
jgi:hypothetical protein